MAGRTHPILSLLFFSAGLFLLGCEKNEDQQKQIKTELQVGIPHPDIAVMLYEPPLTLSVGCNDIEKAELDLDQDGLDDIEISVSWGCFHWGETSTSELSSLNRHLEVSVADWIDTTYTCVETIDEWTYIHASNDPEYYDCPVQQQVELTSSIYPQVHRLGEKLKEDDTWKDGKLVLASYSQHDDAGLMLNPTLTSSFRRGFWNMEEKNYVVFRIRSGSNEIRGWLKIAACPTTVILLEVACEKF